jgi:hypothetical protein
MSEQSFCPGQLQPTYNFCIRSFMGQTYECQAQSDGALLYLPHGTSSEDVIRTKLFEDHIKDNVDSWLRWSKKEGLAVENMEDLILVTGFTLAKSWAIATFDGIMSREDDATIISLEVRKSDDGGTQFVWSDIHASGGVEHHHSDSVCSPAYFFPRRELKIFHHSRILKDSRISASSSGALEQSAVSFGPNTSGLHSASCWKNGRMRAGKRVYFAGMGVGKRVRLPGSMYSVL